METVLTVRVVEDRIRAAQAAVEAAKRAIIDAQQRIDTLQGEIGDLLAAGRVLSRMGGVSAPSDFDLLNTSEVSEFDPSEQTGNPYRASTNKAFMWEVLSQSESVWLSANEIQEAASHRRGSEIPMSSVSPGLSEMKQDGTIERNGMKVALKSRLNENGEAEASPDVEEVGASSNDSQTRESMFG
ncbi:hypothetical protein [Sphingomonas corticis]|jgi:hypothetical protein|uniref:Uncharacterized protein n=1 Tax=Sphingomonas corticis TaxID=2722791 RepID=A0ABX1CJT2_9SPHN|nr:hypothetical protein [Sphingomonas corticis]NJR78252.1 hypothetical protein [Sphingomonas corticis]